MTTPIQDELEEKLLTDTKFQHILKFAPVSQRELMTFELSRYFQAYKDNAALEARIDELDKLIAINGETFNSWTQKDIANFFDAVGKRYRELEAERTNLENEEK